MLAGAVWMRNSNAYPALRSGVESAARTSCDRFTRTRSPAEKVRPGGSVKVTVLSLLENAKLPPTTVPLARPKTRKLDGVTDECRMGSSNVTETVVFAGAMVCRTGFVDDTSGCAAIAAEVASRTAAAARRGGSGRCDMSVPLLAANGLAATRRGLPRVGAAGKVNICASGVAQPVSRIDLPRGAG